MERRGVRRLSTGMEAWHGEEGGEKVVNRILFSQERSENK
jgi:hypothetical protein